MLERIRARDRPRRAELRYRLAERVHGRAPAHRPAPVRRRRSGQGLQRGARWTSTSSRSRRTPRDVRVAFVAGARAAAGGRRRGPGVALQPPPGGGDGAHRARGAHAAQPPIWPSTSWAIWSAPASSTAPPLEAQPQCLPALMGSRRVQLKQGNAAAARATLEAEARASRDPRSAVEAFIAAAKLASAKLNDLDGAAALYRQALEKDPLNPAATAGLEDLLAQRGGTSDLAALHERRAEAKLAQRDADGGRGRLRQRRQAVPHRAERSRQGHGPGGAGAVRAAQPPGRPGAARAACCWRRSSTPRPPRPCSPARAAGRRSARCWRSSTSPWAACTRRT